MTNTEQLGRKIDEAGYKLSYVAEQCGLTYQGFMNKANNKSDFTAPEINKLRILLKLSPEDVERIFFTDDVDKSSTR